MSLIKVFSFTKEQTKTLLLLYICANSFGIFHKTTKIAQNIQIEGNEKTHGLIMN